MGRSKTFQWFSRFKAGRTSTDDNKCSGRPASGSTSETIETMLLMTPSFFLMSLQMKKPGFMPMTWKLKLNPVNGKVQGKSFETFMGECAKEVT
jgi:hypothetical protein